MITKLSQLYNTLSLIETKGESTKIMAQCIVFVENMIKELHENEQSKGKETK